MKALLLAMCFKEIFYQQNCFITFLNPFKWNYTRFKLTWKSVKHLSKKYFDAKYKWVQVRFLPITCLFFPSVLLFSFFQTMCELNLDWKETETALNKAVSTLQKWQSIYVKMWSLIWCSFLFNKKEETFGESLNKTLDEKCICLV